MPLVVLKSAHDSFMEFWCFSVFCRNQYLSELAIVKSMAATTSKGCLQCNPNVINDLVEFKRLNNAAITNRVIDRARDVAEKVRGGFSVVVG